MQDAIDFGSRHEQRTYNKHGVCTMKIAIAVNHSAVFKNGRMLTQEHILAVNAIAWWMHACRYEPIRDEQYPLYHFLQQNPTQTCLAACTKLIAYNETVNLKNVRLARKQNRIWPKGSNGALRENGKKLIKCESKRAEKYKAWVLIYTGKEYIIAQIEMGNLWDPWGRREQRDSDIDKGNGRKTDNKTRSLLSEAAADTHIVPDILVGPGIDQLPRTLRVTPIGGKSQRRESALRVGSPPPK